MKNRIAAILLIFALMIWCCGIGIAESSSANGLGVKQEITTDYGTFYITVQDVSILEGDNWKETAAEKSDDTIMIAIRGIVENESFVAFDDENVQAWRIADHMEVLDQDGFTLEFYNVYGESDGKYQVCPDVKKGSKTRACYPYYANNDIQSVTLKFSNGETVTVALGEDNNAQSSETETEPFNINNFNPSDYSVDELLVVYNHIEDYLNRVAPERLGKDNQGTSVDHSEVEENQSNSQSSAPSNVIIEQGEIKAVVSDLGTTADFLFQTNEKRTTSVVMVIFDLSEQLGKGPINMSDLTDCFSVSSRIGITEDNKNLIMLCPFNGSKTTMVIDYNPKGVIKYFIYDLPYSTESCNLFSEYHVNEYYEVTPDEILSTFDSLGMTIDLPDKKQENSSASQSKDYQTLCFQEVATYLKNPSSAKLINCSEATVSDSDLILYLMDISAQNSFGGIVTDSYFIMYNMTNGMISAISFDGVVSHANDIADQNKMFAKYLALKDGMGSFITNQLKIKNAEFADYLKSFYDSFFK